VSLSKREKARYCWRCPTPWRMAGNRARYISVPLFVLGLVVSVALFILTTFYSSEVTSHAPEGET
jgi:hypothetical protein